MVGKIRVLVCPLDWGIGHATRCVPVIDTLKKTGCEVIVAAGGRPLEFIRKAFPDLRVIEFPGTTITYPKSNRFGLRIFRMLPRFLYGIWKEHRVLRKLVTETGANMVISDNRYGCWHSGIPSVFITHQLEVRLPERLKFLGGFARGINYWFIRKYRSCWIPDFESPMGLGGNLSHPAKLPGNAVYVGILSHFSHIIPDPAGGTQDFDLLVMLSGPEPQRTILEDKLLIQLATLNFQVAFVRGMPESDEVYVLDNRIHVFSHLDSQNLASIAQRSALVVCRSGYSSIMDLVTLGKRAIFIPTPGQTEQEYLAKYLMEKKIYFSENQDDFDLVYALEMSKNYPGIMIRNDHKALESQIRSLISSLPSPGGTG